MSNSIIIIIIIIIIHFREFSTPALADGFPRDFSDSNSNQVFRNPLSIQTDLQNALVWMLSTRPLISESIKCLYKSFDDCTESTIYN